MILNFNSLDRRADAGALVENFVFKQLYSNLTVTDRLNFWRNQNKNEVDFILNGEPIEVKYQHFDSPMITRGLAQFVDRYQPAKTTVITKEYFYQDNKLLFIPYFLM